MVVLDKISFGKKDFKNFISYKTGKKFRTLCILLLKMSAYRRDFDETEYMSFLYKIMNCQKNIMKLGKRSAIESKKDLIVNLYTVKNN